MLSAADCEVPLGEEERPWAKADVLRPLIVLLERNTAYLASLPNPRF